ncbi:MAG TPA: fumarylacetoacetate hydrolase family protein [Planctomycetaceae bacterium]|nr:fumarylacetoacetate hydrolase family protein [Planctomycetaceae bacterium]
MKLAKIRTAPETTRVAIVDDHEAWLLRLDLAEGCRCLADVLHARDPIGLARSMIDRQAAAVPLGQFEFLVPVDQQEVWAAGVTYKRSQVARMEESESGASHYDRVYTADRPELFFKATPERVVGPGEPVRVRFDSRWSVPEPELTLVVSPELKLVGFTIGNDMSARDIEGENPLYLPQAKLYRQSCAVGPCVLVPEHPLDVRAINIVLRVDRAGGEAFRGQTSLSQMARTFENLIGWLGRENEFPNGVLLLTGTGIVPPDEFTLEDGDVVSIEITGIGTLTNPVVKSG